VNLKQFERNPAWLRTLGVITANRALKAVVGNRCNLLSTTSEYLFFNEQKIIYRASRNGPHMSWNAMVPALQVKESDIRESKGWVYFIPPEGHDDGGAEFETIIDQNDEDNDGENRQIDPVHQYRGGDIQGIDQIAGIPETAPAWVQIEYAPIENELDTSESTYAVGTVGSKKVFFYSGLDGGLSVRYKDSRVMYPHINGFEPLN
jgi:hypothetical protein